MDIAQLREWMLDLKNHISERQWAIAEEVVKEINSRLSFMLDVGLDYVSLNRASATLSGGESQRIRLATQIGSQLVNVLYILDEPSIGLHQRDNQRLINSLKRLRDEGNTILVVEHDRDMCLPALPSNSSRPTPSRLATSTARSKSPSLLSAVPATARQ